MLAVYKTMYENASKIALNARRVKSNLIKVAYLMFALCFLCLWVPGGCLKPFRRVLLS